MEKIALVTDSTADLPQELIDKYDVKVLPLKIIYKDREYIDRVDITPSQVYENLKFETPNTSLPSMDEIDSLLTTLENEQYTHVIIVTISSGLSGTFNAMNLVSKNHTNIEICVFDSKALTLGAGELIIKCGEMISNKKTYTEIIEELPKIKDKISVFFVVPTLDYLIKGGRIGRVSGTLGKLLNIKPVISIGEDGVYYTYKKARGQKQAITSLINIVKEKLNTAKLKIWVMHAGNYEGGMDLYNTLKELPGISDINLGEIGPVAGVHAGPGLVGFVLVEE